MISINNTCLTPPILKIKNPNPVRSKLESDSKIYLAKFSIVSLQKGINFQEEMFRKKVQKEMFRKKSSERKVQEKIFGKRPENRTSPEKSRN